MKRPSNLPPGVTESMLPGNTLEDGAWDLLYDDMGGDCSHPEDARKRWESQPVLLEACREALHAFRGPLSPKDLQNGAVVSEMKAARGKLRAAITKAERSKHV